MSDTARQLKDGRHMRDDCLINPSEGCCNCVYAVIPLEKVSTTRYYRSGADKTEAALDNLFPERCQHVVIDRDWNKNEIEAACKIIGHVFQDLNDIGHYNLATKLSRAVEDIRKANQ